MSYANGVLTVGAGARLYDVHAFLDRYGRSLPTGTCPTVGVAGLTLGGGMGIHTRTYGLTCDRVVSIGVITADGKAHNVSATSGVATCSPRSAEAAAATSASSRRSSSRRSRRPSSASSG